MRKIFVLLAMILATAVTAIGASAAIINVTKANYVVTKVYRDRQAFGVDLIQNGASDTRTEIRLNKDAHCYRVHKGGGRDTPMSIKAFMRSLHKGTRVRVTGGRDWDGKVNASDVWAQD